MKNWYIIIRNISSILKYSQITEDSTYNEATSSLIYREGSKFHSMNYMYIGMKHDFEKKWMNRRTAENIVASTHLYIKDAETVEKTIF